MIATIAVIAERKKVQGPQRSQRLYGFHMIAVIAAIAEHFFTAIAAIIWKPGVSSHDGFG